MEFKAEIKKTFTGPDKLRAVCSVVLDDCFLVKNVRVVEGEKGLFVSRPSRRNVKGEWVEHCFPMTKELRAKLSAAVLEAYEAAVQNEKLPCPDRPPYSNPYRGRPSAAPRKEVVADWNIS